MAGMINALAMRQAVMANTPHTATASGSMASFSTDMVGKLRHLVVGIEPVQDLHGYDYPWPAGGGKNLIQQMRDFNDITVTTQTYYDIVYARGDISQYTLVEGITYTISFDVQCNVEPFMLSVGCGDGYYKKDIRYAGNLTSGRVSLNFTPTADNLERGAIFAFRPVRYGNIPSQGFTFSVSNIQLELGSTATSYAPYSNICPITGWTGLTLNHSGADTSNPDTLNISWESVAGTVYGATIDVVTGVLTVDRANVPINSITWTYNSEYHRFNSAQVTDIVAPSANNVALANFICTSYRTGPATQTGSNGINGTIGVGTTKNVYIRDEAFEDVDEWLAKYGIQRIVYPLATPQTYQLTPTMVKSLIGTNHVWADTGDVESLTYWTH